MEVAVYDGEKGLKEVLGRADVKAVIAAVPIGRTAEIVRMALAAGKHGRLVRFAAKGIRSSDSS